MKVFYSDAYVRAGYAFDTVRKSAAIASSLALDPIPGAKVVPPQPATPEVLTLVHDTSYVEAVRCGSPRYLAESQGFPWDGGIWESTAASTGGCIAAARAAIADGVSGSLSSGLHHARRASGKGFCTFNGLAVAATVIASEERGSVLILDLDAHCGGGTASILRSDQRMSQLDVAVNSFDTYDPAPGRGTLDIVRNARRYLYVIRRRLKQAPSNLSLILYNAGMDPFEGCDIGGLEGITADVLKERERLVFTWAAVHRVPVAFVVAGGYAGRTMSIDTLVALHRLTVTAAADAAQAWSGSLGP